MTRENAVSRRKALKVTGAAATTALVAGCGGGGNGNGNGEDGGNGDDSGNGGGSDGTEIEPGTTIELDAQTTEWTGIAPDSIADASNPTLILTEGETYTIGWPQGDGGTHNIELRNDSGEVVEDYETETTNEEEPGDSQMIEFEATSEIVEYVCRPHESQMVGEIQVE
ncbi:cupredoxin domain-containing protein [Halopiger aswanensis]|uniref:Copper binding plastocyanin/azurin family protein n=1 Tax=Halopiger aswanensis TaxID=148449 RepID=A0A3R7KK56_9EURY|nr:plastocyanin/azurin family copper-binding protein [Halopiger aswanensis]RKD93906.1 copper binding plastocyanin/azurin family protein [Halopiger aswanensis]